MFYNWMSELWELKLLFFFFDKLNIIIIIYRFIYLIVILLDMLDMWNYKNF